MSEIFCRRLRGSGKDVPGKLEAPLDLLKRCLRDFLEIRIIIAGVEKFSAGFMGHKMDTMRIEILDVQCGGENTALDTHRNITTKTTPQGTTILASK